MSQLDGVSNPNFRIFRPYDLIFCGLLWTADELVCSISMLILLKIKS